MMVKAATLALPGISHAFFTREGGVSSGCYASLNGGIGSDDSARAVAENRARMAAALGVEPPQFLTAYQIHSPQVVVAETGWTTEARPRADGIVTQTPGLAVGVSTADCGPVLFADPQAGVVGAAHAGWRGALTGIVEATVAAMERLGAARERTHAALGPMIRQPNYEVGPDLIGRFAAEDADSAEYFVPAKRPGHALFDLAGYVTARLRRAGITQVEDVGLCTYADPALFFSYRRATHRAERDYGRHVNAIALAADRRRGSPNAVYERSMQASQSAAVPLEPAGIAREKPAGTRP
jgi:polyphenol oxidase